MHVYFSLLPLLFSLQIDLWWQKGFRICYVSVFYRSCMWWIYTARVETWVLQNLYCISIEKNHSYSYIGVAKWLLDLAKRKLVMTFGIWGLFFFKKNSVGCSSTCSSTFSCLLHPNWWIRSKTLSWNCFGC